MTAPNLRFKEFDSDWLNTSFQSLFTFKNGINASKEQYGSGTKFINVLDIINNSNGITFDSIIGSVQVSEKEIEKNLVKYGDVLFQRSSETREEVGQSNVYLSHEPVVFGGFVIRGTAQKEYDPIFMNSVLKTEKLRDQITQLSGGSTRFNIGQDSLNKVFAYLPSKKEQTKIASFLSTVDEKINQLNQKHSLLSKYKQGMMQKLFSQQIRFKADDGNEFGEWENKTISEIAFYRRGSFPQPYGLPEWLDKNGFPFVQVYDVADNMLLKDKTKIKISQLAANQSVLAKAGTLIITLQGSIGRVAKMQYDAYVDRTLLIFQSYMMPINTDYFKYALYLLFNVEKEKADGGIIKTITKETLSKFDVGVPCLEEQTKIANFLSAIDQKIEVVAQQIEHAKQWKKGVLQQMFV